MGTQSAEGTPSNREASSRNVCNSRDASKKLPATEGMPATESMPATTLTTATARSNSNSREASEYTAGMPALAIQPKEMPATLGASNRRYASKSSVVHSFAYVSHFVFLMYIWI